MTDKEMIQQTINDYATYADTRQTQKQFDLFTKNGSMTVYYPWNDPEKPDQVNTPESMMATFEALKQYDHTFHFIGQSSINMTNPDKPTAYVYTIAHHVSTDEDGNKNLMVAYLRYNDEFEKQNGRWLFSHRELHADFIENRPMK